MCRAWIESADRGPLHIDINKKNIRLEDRRQVTEGKGKMLEGRDHRHARVRGVYKVRYTDESTKFIHDFEVMHGLERTPQRVLHKIPLIKRMVDLRG